MTQTGALKVTGTTGVNAGTGNVTLTNANNTFDGAVSASGNNIALTDAGPLTLGTDTTSGNLTVNSTGALNLGTSTVGGNLSANSGNGDVTQTGALKITGTTGVNAGTGNVTLTHANNTFGGAVSVTGNNVSLNDSVGDLLLGNIVNAGNLRVSNTGGAISQAANDTVISQGTTILSAAKNGSPADITLGNIGNNFVGAVSANGNNVWVNDTVGGLILADMTTTGTLTASAEDSIAQVVGSIINATGAASFISKTGSIQLSASGNSFKSGNNLPSASATTVVAPVVTAIVLPAPISSPAPLQAVTTPSPVASSSLTTVAASPTSNSPSISTSEFVSSGSTSLSGSTVGSSSSSNATVGNINVNALSVVSQASTSSSADSSSSSTTGSAGSVGNGGVSISLLRQPTLQQSGFIAVSVPKEMATAGNGFSFPLPAQVANAAANSNSTITVSTASGQALPSWLKFNPETKSFIASAVPDGAFPMQVVVTVGGRSTTIVISERVQ